MEGVVVPWWTPAEETVLQVWRVLCTALSQIRLVSDCRVDRKTTSVGSSTRVGAPIYRNTDARSHSKKGSR